MKPSVNFRRPKLPAFKAGPGALRGPFGMPALRVGRAFGIPIGLEPTFFPLVALLIFMLTPEIAERFEAWPRWLAGGAAAATALLFLGCVLLHELGHGVVANRLGVRVHSIVMHLFGGVAWMSREPDRARDEFLIAVAGPVVNVVLGGAALIGLLLWPEPAPGPPPGLGAQLGLWILQAGLGLNATLVLFNCVPGFPLDGGRVLRSMIWAATGSYRSATFWASWIGSAIAGGLIGGGVALLAARGFDAHRVWMAMIGAFLLRASRASLRRLPTTGDLVERKVGEAMNAAAAQGAAGPPVAPDIPAPPISPGLAAPLGLGRAPGAMTLGEFRAHELWAGGHENYLVESDGVACGLLNRATLEALLPAGLGRDLSLRALSIPLTGLPPLAPNDSVWKALSRMDETGLSCLPVAREDGTIIGAVTRRGLRGLVRREG